LALLDVVMGGPFWLLVLCVLGVTADDRSCRWAVVGK
jgi:hypothetical protein